MRKTLYICYFGVREPLVQTQVLPYLRELRAGAGHGDGETRGLGGLELRVSIVTFEPEALSGQEVLRIREELAAEGIDWHWLRYHKRFSALATAYDIFRGAWFVRQFIKKEKPDILHGRVHVPTLMGALARKFSRHKPKLLFDIRGFFPEEYTDAGIWPENGLLYRSAKRVERWLMKESDGFVVLTEKAREILFPNAVRKAGENHPAGEAPAPLLSKEGSFDEFGRPIEVIPCCVDFESRFAADGAELRESMRRKLGIENRFVITHVGALGGLYLTEEIADFLAAAKSVRPETFALFLTQTDPMKIIPLLERRGFQKSDYFVTKVAPTQVQDYLAASDVALSFVKSGYATASRSPTKIPEYLACGLPIIANRGVGDVDALIANNKVGALVDDFSSAGYVAALEAVEELGNVSSICEETALREFDLEKVGGHRYRRLYKRISGYE